MVVVPAATGVARPVWSIVATPVLLEFQDTGLVREVRVPEAVYPLAENCSITPSARGAGFAGDTTTSAISELAAPGCVTLTVMLAVISPLKPAALAVI